MQTLKNNFTFFGGKKKTGKQSIYVIKSQSSSLNLANKGK